MSIKLEHSRTTEKVKNAVVDIVYENVHGVELAPKEPDEVLVERHLESWLDPGWCRTAPDGSECNLNRKGKHRLWAVAGVLMLLWLLLVASYPMGGVIPIVLAFAIVIGLLSFVRRQWLPPTRVRIATKN